MTREGSTITAYGKKVKKRLVDLEMSQHDLIEAVKENTGMFFDNSYLYKILRGERKPDAIITAINEILSIEG